MVVIAAMWFHTNVFSDEDAFPDQGVHWREIQRKEAKLPLSENLEKKVLVLPFHRMKLVEKKSNRFNSRFSDSVSLWEDGDSPIEVSSVFKTRS